MGQALKKDSNKRNEAKFKIKEDYFIRNGGILVEKQIALSQGQNISPGQLRIFSVEDIEKATNCFNPSLIISRVRFTIYKGTVDNHIVAIRAAVDLEPRPQMTNRDLTAASAGLVMSHNNIIKLYGCCLETRVPILVYEFLPNGSLFHCIHGGIALRKSLKWHDRLRIATDVSYALSYMHNALPKPVVHRNVKSLNVRLDQSFNAKLSNLRHAVAITPGETQKWPVKGKPGYVDPEHVETLEVTDKCDVYSFGVLMLELLTGMQPNVVAKEGKDLVDEFVSAVGKYSMMEMIDSEVLDTGSVNEIEQVARLALRCVAKKGMERPTMIEIVSKLWLIRAEERNYVM